MDKPHQKIVSTYPIAIKNGQPRIHVPTYFGSYKVRCPNCDTTYAASCDFPLVELLDAFKVHHRGKIEHPDYIASEPSFTSLEYCDCDRERNSGRYGEST